MHGTEELAAGGLEISGFNIAMMISGAILVLTFGAIFTEGLHKIHRTKIALLGAGAMVLAGQLFGFYNPELAVEAIEWNVVFLLGAMMTIVSIMAPTGGFQAIAYWIARICQGKPFLLMIMMGTAVTVISLLLDNVTTVVIFGPLIVLICQVLGISPIPHLMAAALLSDTGGVATLVGDPTALMIGTAAEISFVDYVKHMGGIVFVAWSMIVLTLCVVFYKRLKKKPAEGSFSDKYEIEDKRTWYAALCVMAVMVVLFIIHGKLEWEAWVVSVLGMTALFLISRKENPDSYLEKIELSLLMFFISLFVIVGGVEQSQLLEYLGSNIEPFVRDDLLMACIVLMWVAAIASALIDNIPFTAAMIPVIQSMETQGINVSPLWWALAIGVGLGGNGSHVGSTANVFIVTLSEKMAKRERKPHLAITPGLWFRKGLPAMVLTLITSSIIMTAFFQFYETPIEPTDNIEHRLEGVLSPAYPEGEADH